MNLMQLTLVFLLLISGSIATTESTVQVTFPNGGPSITGQVLIESSLNRTINRFLGLPYALPPVGKQRFRRPVPWEPNGSPSLNALEWPNNCVQSFIKISDIKVTSDEYMPLSKNYSEDCLYLNVWTPEIGDDEEARLRPVMVWFHGGGLLYGTSTLELYNGLTLASRTDAVIVTVNYRLNTLGFLYSDEVPDIKGNQGLWDQTQALKWVHQNIRNFGGNPKRITIFGESAGAWSVSAHLLSPASRDLYQNAMLMSGSAIFKIAQKPETLVQKWLRGIRKAGCANEGDKSISQKVVECLENLDPKTVAEIAFEINPNNLDFQDIMVVDGEFLPELPIKLLKSGNFKKNVSLLVDTVDDEGSFLLYMNKYDERFAEVNPKPIALEQSKQFLLDLLAKEILHTTKLPNETIARVYFSGLNAIYDRQDLFRRQVGVALGDLLLGCPTLLQVQSMFRSSPESVQVYQWYYTLKIGDKRKWACSEWSGTCHANDLAPVFGSAFRHAEHYHIRERDVSGEIINVIKEFIRTGKPGQDQPQWQSYFMENQNETPELIAPYYEIGDQPRTAQSYRFNLKKLECEVLWEKFIEAEL